MKSVIRARVYALLLAGLALAADSVSAQRVPTAQAYTFNPVTIVGGGYSPAIIGHPGQAGLIYLRTDIGSAYKLNPAAGQWMPLTDYHPPSDYNLNGPESIALDPTDPNRLYIAAGMYTSSSRAAILVSQNQGDSFVEYPTPFRMGANNDGRAAGERLAVNPFNPAQLFMGTRQAGLWKSEDHAQTWTQVGSFPVTSSQDNFGVQSVLFDPQHSDILYVSTFTDHTIYRSTDDGATWAPVPGQPTAWPFTVGATTRVPSVNRALINPDGNVYFVFGDSPGPNSMNAGMIMKYNPVDNSWTNITPPPIPADGQNSPRGGFSGISQDPNSSGFLAVSTFARWYPVDTVYVTRDGGATWVDLGHLASVTGVNGPAQGNYYLSPPAFSIAPWLTFGDMGTPTRVATAKYGWWMSALLIDPTNPDHLMFATGATVYATSNLSAAFPNGDTPGTSPTWYVQAFGIEETAVLSLMSPSAGAHLFSGVGDIGGFRHDNFNEATQMFRNPVAGNVGSMDWAGQNPSTLVRVQSPSRSSTAPCNFGAISTDGGDSWNPFQTCATGGNSGGAGNISVDASGATVMWTPPGNTSVPQFSTAASVGAAWTAATGLPSRFTAVADKVTPNQFYAFGGGNFYSTAGSNGSSFAFTSVNKTGLPNSNGSVIASFAAAGDLWLSAGGNGLHHSTDGGVNWTKISTVTGSNSVALGAPAPGNTNPSVFLYGVASPLGVQAIYRSDDNGASWLRINDDLHQYGGPSLIQADPRVYGRVYMGMNGRGVIYGDISSN